MKLPQWWRSQFLPVEFILGLLLTFAFVAWAEEFRGMAVISRILNGNRAAVYGTLASIFGSLLGFVIATVSIVLGFSTSDRMAIVRESRHYKTLWRVFKSATRALGFATLVSMLGLLVDRDGTPAPALMFACVLACILAILRLVR